MAIDIKRLEDLCKGENLKYFLAPDRPMVTMHFGGVHGRFQVVVHIEVEGRFLQARTVGYLNCPADHPAKDKVLEIIGHLDYQLRMVKFGWDPSDGEIVAYCDVWVEDGKVTQKQFSALFKALLPAIDLNYKRFTETMETNEDPGEVRPESISKGGLPPELRRLIDKAIAEAGDKDEEEDDDSGFDKV